MATIVVAPSLLSADFARLGQEVASAEAAGADWIHLDIMDGRFVPNLTFGPPVVASLRQVTHLPLDVHLMVVEPGNLFSAFARAGADWLTFHVEAEPHAHRALAAIRELGLKAGVALNPGTPLAAVEELLPHADLVLAMTVNPGFGGQSFIPSVRDKIRRLRAAIDTRQPTCRLEVDGGIAPGETAAAVRRAGADTLVAGSAFFGASDRAAAVAGLRG